MKNIILLDCTLRDGGYYNNWDFSDALVKNYLQVMKSCSIDYVELGRDEGPQRLTIIV